MRECKIDDTVVTIRTFSWQISRRQPQAICESEIIASYNSNKEEERNIKNWRDHAEEYRYAILLGHFYLWNEVTFCISSVQIKTTGTWKKGQPDLSIFLVTWFGCDRIWSVIINFQLSEAIFGPFDHVKVPTCTQTCMSEDRNRKKLGKAPYLDFQ